MGVYVEAERRSKPLHEVDRARVRERTRRIEQARRASPAYVGREHRIDEGARDLTEQVWIRREVQTQRNGHGKHPLPRRHIRDHTVHEVGRELGHPPSSARRAEPARLARERDEQVERAARTAHPTEAVRDVTTGDDGAQLALDVRGQRTSAMFVRVPYEEGLEVRPQDPVHHAARRVAAHQGMDAVSGQVVGAHSPTVLLSVPEALANP